MLAVDRRLIDLEVAGVHDDADRRVNRQRHAVGHAVRHADEFHRERADRDAVVRPHGNEVHGIREAVFLQLGFDERQRERGAVDRTIEQRNEVRHAADVIFVAMRQHERSGRPLLLQVGEIRNDPVHAEQLGVREHHAGIDDNRRLTPREREHVHAELAKSAERYDFEHSLRRSTNLHRHCSWRNVSGEVEPRCGFGQAAGRA